MQETHYNDGRIDRKYFESKEAMTQSLANDLDNPEVREVRGSKIGRNDPCPCGSGHKFKKCCIRNLIPDYLNKNIIGGGK